MNDDKLAEDLRAAYERKLPGREFDDAVMERTLAESGGEHEVSLDPPRGRRWWPLAAAAALVLLFVGAMQLGGPDPVAPQVQCNLPEPAAPGNERIVVAIDAEGKTSVGGVALTEEQLKQYLTLRARECRADGEEEPYVLIRGDRKTASAHIQKFLQLCGEEEVGIHKFQFATRKDVEPPVVPKAKPAGHALYLLRKRGEEATRVELNSVELGKGDAGFDALRKALAEARADTATLRADPAVPHAEVIRAIDALMAVGITEITFVGVPPPSKPKPEPAPKPTVVVYLNARNDHIVLSMKHDGRHHELAEGLKALDEYLKKLLAAGQKPSGILEAGVYMDANAVNQVLKVFQDNGIHETVIIR